MKLVYTNQIQADSDFQGYLDSLMSDIGLGH